MYKRQLPEGLVESDKLPEPIYTPSTKADLGDHDENISFEKSVEAVSYTHLDVYKRQIIVCCWLPASANYSN